MYATFTHYINMQYTYTVSMAFVCGKARLKDFLIDGHFGGFVTVN